MRAYEKTFERLKQHAHQTALWVTTESVLGWDERTMMPSAAADCRTEQITLLAGTIHARRTDPELGRWLIELAESPLAADPTSDAGATIRYLKRDYDKRVKLPQSLVEELARTASIAQHVWQEARPRNDFGSFQAVLAKMFELKRARPKHSATPTRSTIRCSTTMSRVNRRPTSPMCWPSCVRCWCRWWRRSPTVAGSPTSRF